MVKALVEAGANINHRAVYNVTPLIGVAANGKEDIVRFLISSGANLSSVYHRCRDKFGAKINAKFSQLSWYYVAKKCDNKRDIAFFLHLL